MSSRSLVFLRVGAISFMMQRIPKNTPQFTVEWSMRPQECNFPASIGTLCCALTLPVWILSVANLARIDGSVLTPQSSEIAEALITFPPLPPPGHTVTALWSAYTLSQHSFQLLTRPLSGEPTCTRVDHRASCMDQYRRPSNTKFSRRHYSSMQGLLMNPVVFSMAACVGDKSRRAFIEATATMFLNTPASD